MDQRQNSLSAFVRTNQMTREAALAELNTQPHLEPPLVELVKTRLGFTDEEFDSVIKAPLKTYRDYKTYKKTFERLKPFFWLLLQFELVPKSFYIKFTSKTEI